MLLVWSTVPWIHRWLFSVILADEEDRMETVINGIGFFATGLLPGAMVFFSGAPFSRLHRPGVWINALQIITAGIVMARLVPTPA